MQICEGLHDHRIAKGGIVAGPLDGVRDEDGHGAVDVIGEGFLKHDIDGKLAGLGVLPGRIIARPRIAEHGGDHV